MSFVITDCVRCGTDFMYHNTDTHLNTEVGVQCQDCFGTAELFTFIKLFYNFHDFETYKQECKQVVDSGYGDKLIEHYLMVHDGEHGWRQLTEREFNARFLNFKQTFHGDTHSIN